MTGQVAGEVGRERAATPLPIEHGTVMPNGPVAYPPTAVLTAEQAAGMLQVSMTTFDRLDIPCCYLVGRTEATTRRRRSMRRYLVADILKYLEKRRVA